LARSRRERTLPPPVAGEEEQPMDLVSRARNMVSDPRGEWPVIAAEPDDITALYSSYVVILAGVPLIAELIRTFFVMRSFNFAVGAAVSGYVMALIGVAVLGFFSSKLAPVFGGTDELNQGFKLAAYAQTPAWLGGVFVLLPWIGGVLALIAALYSVYVFYLGIPDLTRVPARRRLGYILLVVLLTIIVSGAFEFLVGKLTGHTRLIAMQ
jgi:hypothetical protein